MTHLWTLIPHTIPFFPVRTTACLIPPTPQDTAGYGSQLLDYCHGAISSGKACHSPRITEHPFVLGRCPASDTQWRPLPSGSVAGRRGPGRSYRPATTRDTWRSGDRRRRWVRPARACHVVSDACVMDSGVGGQRVCVYAQHRLIPPHPFSIPAELSTSSLCSNGRG